MQSIRNSIRQIICIRQRPEIFSDSVLPSTMKLANFLDSNIKPKLSKLPKSWPFEDKVLVWLSPSMRNDAELFHAGKGNQLRDILDEAQLEQLDNDLLRLLAK